MNAPQEGWQRTVLSSAKKLFRYHDRLWQVSSASSNKLFTPIHNCLLSLCAVTEDVGAKPC